jgi:hypothetical protein
VFPVKYEHHLHTKSKDISVTDCGGLKCCEMLRIPRSLDSRPTVGGGVVNLKHRPRSIPQKLFYFFLCYSFLLQATILK